eukprot:364971-Chlamydomonas_euryale.AAC.7
MADVLFGRQSHPPRGCCHVLPAITPTPWLLSCSAGNRNYPVAAVMFCRQSQLPRLRCALRQQTSSPHVTEPAVLFAR